MSRLPLSHPCIYKHHPEKKTNNHKKADSNYHAVVWRPIGGVTDEQIQLLYNQFRKDLGQGQPRIAHRGTFSIEGKGRERHVHIALILIGRADTWVTSNRYKTLLGDQTLLDGCSVDGVKIPKKSSSTLLSTRVQQNAELQTNNVACVPCQRSRDESRFHAYRL